MGITGDRDGGRETLESPESVGPETEGGGDRGLRPV